jgi:hypothetical protein
MGAWTSYKPIGLHNLLQGELYFSYYLTISPYNHNRNGGAAPHGLFVYSISAVKSLGASEPMRAQ